jgi:PAS domain S-box-containing protein
VTARRQIPISALLCVVLPTLGSVALQQGLGDAQWRHEPIHSSLETAGGLIALAMAAVLLWRRRYAGHAPHLLWVATALVLMGLLDIAHAWVHPGPAFFWSRMLPSLLGGLLLTLVWAPERWSRGRAAERLPFVVGLLTLPLCGVLVAPLQVWPPGFAPDGTYTLWAKLTSFTGGLAFFVSAAFFLRRYWREAEAENLVLANHCLLFAMAGVLFGMSHLWGAIWWLFHVLRLLAYVVVLRHVVRVYRTLQSAEEASLIARLERSEAQMRLVTDALPVLVSFIRSEHGRYVYAYANRGYTDWFGLRREEVVDHPVSEVVGDAAFELVRPLLERAMAGESLSYERTLFYPRAGTRHVRASYMPERNARGEVEGVVALVADISSEHRARQQAERLQAVTSALSQALTPADVARVSLRELVDGGGSDADSGTFYALEAEGGPLRLLYAHGLPEGTVVGFDAVPVDAQQPMASVIRSAMPEWIGSREEMLARYPGMSAGVQVSGNRSWAVLPLLGRAKPLGALVLGFKHERSLDERERAFLLALGQQAAHALERATLYEAERGAVRIREEFLSIAGHELRTPLTSLKLQLRMLERTLAPASHDGSVHRLQVIERQVSRLEGLVASLLDVGRLSAGRLQLELSDVDLSALTREVLERLADVFEQAECQVAFEDEPAVRGRWDAGKLDQVLVNLLTNAAKYGAGHPVRVRVEHAGTLARLTVTDEGIGIAPEVLPRIFGRFERGVSGRQYGGLGLGLYISLELVRGMGGEVRVHSRLGEGATFIVELPLPSSPQGKDASHSA